MTESDWVGYTPDTIDQLPNDIRDRVKRQAAERERQRGRLLGVVQVHVYERATDPQVSFPGPAVLGPDSAPAEIARIVERAREELGERR